MTQRNLEIWEWEECWSLTPGKRSGITLGKLLARSSIWFTWCVVWRGRGLFVGKGGVRYNVQLVLFGSSGLR